MAGPEMSPQVHWEDSQQGPGGGASTGPGGGLSTGPGGGLSTGPGGGLSTGPGGGLSTGPTPYYGNIPPREVYLDYLRNNGIDWADDILRKAWRRTAAKRLRAKLSELERNCSDAPPVPGLLPPRSCLCRIAVFQNM